ncbi:MAG TPA: Cu(I)-responsive transcriptional regulator [Nevskiales bacterium]|nr:Cu(I)-responsive transcriptional regulator [Nevskiales bacterium]
MPSEQSGLMGGTGKAAGDFNIGQAAVASGVSAKMIRHYESLGLIRKPRRTLANYRVYTEADLHMLRFIRRARDLGFSMREIKDLLGLWQNKRRESAQVRRLASAHVEALDRKIEEMKAMRDALQDLVRRCHGDRRPECPILDDLGGAAHGH